MRIPGLTASSSKSSLRQSANNELVASTAIWKSFDSAYCCIPQSVAERAAAIPDRTAVVCGERAITYAELETQSNQIAQRLSSIGVGPDVPVAICLPRSEASVTTALAVLKAGGAYLPLDPEYPVEKLGLAFVGGAAVAAHRGDEEGGRAEALEVIDGGPQDRDDVGDAAAAGGDGHGLAGADARCGGHARQHPPVWLACL